MIFNARAISLLIGAKSIAFRSDPSHSGVLPKSFADAIADP